MTRYYYAIKEISIGGRCVCNGHAYICPPTEPNSQVLQCECQHRTKGQNCEECQDGFTQKKWRRSSMLMHSNIFSCEDAAQQVLMFSVCPSTNHRQNQYKTVQDSTKQYKTVQDSARQKINVMQMNT